MESNKEFLSTSEAMQQVDWRGSSVVCASLKDLLGQAAEQPIVVYDRADFDTPIDRVQASIQKVEVHGEPATTYQVDIMADRSGKELRELLQNFKLATLLRKHRELSDGSLKVGEVGMFSRTYRITDSAGYKGILASFPDSGRIALVNACIYNKNGRPALEAIPPIDGTIAPEALFAGFARAMIFSLDYISGLKRSKPEKHKLQRTYQLGEIVKPYQGRQLQRNVGSVAVEASEQTTSPATATPAEQASSPSEYTESMVTLDDIGGLEDVKGTLRDIATSFKNPEIMDKWEASRPQGILLYGDPGTGKTMLAQALAHEIGATLKHIQSTDIYDKWHSNSEKNMKKIFEEARAFEGRLVLFFDEFDSIINITEGKSGADNARNGVAGIFKQEMNDLVEHNPYVLIVAATNDLDRVDPSLVRSGRFDHKVYVAA